MVPHCSLKKKKNLLALLYNKFHQLNLNSFLITIKNIRIMKIVTVETLQGERYEEMGIVSGSTIQSKNFVSDFGQGLKSIVGGELRSYTDMMEKARNKATQRMIDEANRLGADAVIGVRYATSAIMAQAAEVLVYGTAIKYKNN